MDPEKTVASLGPEYVANFLSGVTVSRPYEKSSFVLTTRRLCAVGVRPHNLLWQESLVVDLKDISSIGIVFAMPYLFVVGIGLCLTVVGIVPGLVLCLVAHFNKYRCAVINVQGYDYTVPLVGVSPEACVRFFDRVFQQIRECKKL